VFFAISLNVDGFTEETIMKLFYEHKGQALIITLAVSVFLIVTSLAFFTVVINERFSLENSKFFDQAFYLAEGASVKAAEDFKVAIFNDPEIEEDLKTAGATWPHDFIYDDGEFTGAAAHSTIFRIAAFGDTDTQAVDEYGFNNATAYYGILTELTEFSQSTSIRPKIYKALKRTKTPLLQFLVFDHDDWGITGNFSELKGRIFANGDINFGPWLPPDGIPWETGIRIKSNFIHSAGKIYHWNPYDADKSTWQWPDVYVSYDPDDQDNFDKMLPMKIKTSSNSGILYDASASVPEELVDGARTYYGQERYDGVAFVPVDWETVALERWNGIVQDSTHGVEPTPQYDIGSIAPDGYFGENAGLTVVMNEFGDTILYNSEDNALTEGIDYATGAISFENTFYDKREGKNTAKVVVDMEALAGQCNCLCKENAEDIEPTVPCPNNIPDNGLIYVDNQFPADSFNTPAVGLRNSKEIFNPASGENTGLTIVTDKIIYSEGDFNNPDNPDDKKIVMLISDALVALSNNYRLGWDDTDTVSGFIDRPALDTTINAALIKGRGPELLERWWFDGEDQRNLTINGAFIQIFDTNLYQGPNGCGQWYTAPNRIFTYDERFDDFDNLPPFAPDSIQIVDSAWISGKSDLASYIDLAPPTDEVLHPGVTKYHFVIE